MNNGLLVIVVVVAVVLLLFWFCGSGMKEQMTKEKSMKKEVGYMADSLKKMAHEKADVVTDQLADKLKKAVHKVKGKVSRAKESNFARKMTDVSEALKHKMNDPDTAEELKAMAECLDDMAEDLLHKGGTKEGYYGGYYRPRWRYWRYYRPYRFYRPSYFWGGYW